MLVCLLHFCVISLERNGTERLNDIHILDTATSTWTCPHIGGVLPHPRAGMTLTALRGRLYLFGGSGTRYVQRYYGVFLTVFAKSLSFFVP